MHADRAPISVPLFSYVNPPTPLRPPSYRLGDMYVAHRHAKILRVCRDSNRRMLFHGWSRLYLHAASLSAAEGGSAAATADAWDATADATGKHAGATARGTAKAEEKAARARAMLTEEDRQRVRWLVSTVHGIGWHLIAREPILLRCGDRGNNMFAPNSLAAQAIFEGGYPLLGSMILRQYGLTINFKKPTYKTRPVSGRLVLSNSPSTHTRDAADQSLESRRGQAVHVPCMEPPLSVFCLP